MPSLFLEGYTHICRLFLEEAFGSLAIRSNVIFRRIGATVYI